MLVNTECSARPAHWHIKQFVDIFLYDRIRSENLEEYKNATNHFWKVYSQGI